MIIMGKDQPETTLTDLIRGMTIQMGRVPTEDEVMRFIFSDSADERKSILKGS